MYSFVFPDLNKWFEAKKYVEHNSCEMLEINMKSGLSCDDLNEFHVSLAKYICSIRCSSKLLYCFLQALFVESCKIKMVLPHLLVFYVE